MQREHSYETALAQLKTKPSVILQNLQKFVPYLNVEGILRVGGRLDYCNNLTEEEKHPVFLPQTHSITIESSSKIRIEYSC